MKMKRICLFLAIGLAIFAACNTEGVSQEPEPIVGPVYPSTNLKLTRAEQEMVSNSNEFAFNLFRQITVSDYTKSYIVSPLSITYALGMLNNGAAGNTQAQINEVLGFGSTGADSINAFCYKMIKTAPALDSLTKVLIANTIYMNKGYTLKDGFVNKAKSFYNAEPETRDFHDGETMDVINKWASDHTERMIDRILDENSFDPNAVSYLLNAIYFKGTWTYKFDKGKTEDEQFLHAGDTQDFIQCPMMRQTAQLKYAVTDDFQALCLPYGNGSFQMTILLPRIKEGHDANELPAVPTAETWQLLNSNMQQCNVDVKLPRFETDSEIDLIEVMSALGMPDAFSAEKADFSNFCNKSTYIGLMKQVAKIKLDEEGSEAAAVTVIGMKRNSGKDDTVRFHANHPFLYVISEKQTGAIFFIGRFTGY